VFSTTPIQSENSAPMETKLSVKTSSNEDFVRLLDETQVNHYWQNSQLRPSICALSSDIFAVAWQSAGQDSGTTGVYARVFDATTGDEITPEFRVNDYTTSSQTSPSICALSSDTFAVAWNSFLQDTSTFGVYARVFNATTGDEITPEFRVNDHTSDEQWYPSICALSSDTFAVAWQSEKQDSGTKGIYARVFNASTGDEIIPEFRVNDYTTSSQTSPSICALSSDTFAVAWQSSGQDSGTWGVYARVFNASTGDEITPEFRVNYAWENHQTSPSICALSSDKFAVAWQSEGQDGSATGVYASVFNATAGENITREFQVNQYTLLNQWAPSICALSNDTLAVAWQSEGQDSGTYGVYARVFNATTGNNITQEFQVNDHTDDDQQYPTICALSSETFTVAWESDEQDGYWGGIYASVFGEPSTSSPSLPSGDDGDDDDDDEELNVVLIVVVVSVVSAGAVVGVIVVLIKKGVILSSKAAAAAARA